MQKLKVVKQLFTMTEAKVVAIFISQEVANSDRGFSKVDIQLATELYNTNPGLFDNIGMPLDGQYVVLVYYSKIAPLVNSFGTGRVEKIVSMNTKRNCITVNHRAFTVIQYVSRMVKGEIVKVIEWYTVLDSEIKHSSIIPLAFPQLKAS